MIKETYPKMHVLKSIRTDEDAMTIAEETRNLLEKEKYLKGIFITCGGVREVGKVLKEQGKEDIKVICYEDYPDIFAVVKGRSRGCNDHKPIKSSGKTIHRVFVRLSCL